MPSRKSLLKQLVMEFLSASKESHTVSFHIHSQEINQKHLSDIFSRVDDEVIVLGIGHQNSIGGGTDGQVERN